MIYSKVNKKRIYVLRDGEVRPLPVAYWMDRDQRSNDNWALLYSQEMALNMKVPLVVVFCLVPEFHVATTRQYEFMLVGLQEVYENLSKKNISFTLLVGDPTSQIPAFVKKNKIGILITDFDPLKIKRKWKERVKDKIDIPFYEVDSHNIVPCRYVSSKQEYAAYTFRPKIKKLLPEFIVEYPKIKKHPFGIKRIDSIITTIEEIKRIKSDESFKLLRWLKPGENHARKILKTFISNKLPYYHIKRNDPNEDAQSNLSPYLHFGQISAQRVVLEVMNAEVPPEPKGVFLEELIVRRELSDNFCHYNPFYDSFQGFPEWAKKTLNKHRKDKRQFIYSLEDFEFAKTHDPLWNAAQIEMIKKGKMHGYLRMYWAKKILEWTPSPEEAIDIAIYLNDKYELDGRDPNGYTGIAWSIGGVHDRAWPERHIFGKIRYMSYKGAEAKFDVKSYIKKISLIDE